MTSKLKVSHDLSEPLAKDTLLHGINKAVSEQNFTTERSWVQIPSHVNVRLIVKCNTSW